MFCSKCGKEINETDKFCNNCGHPTTNTLIASDKTVNTESNNNEKKSSLFGCGCFFAIFVCFVFFIMIIYSSGKNYSEKYKIENIDNDKQWDELAKKMIQNMPDPQIDISDFNDDELTFYNMCMEHLPKQLPRMINLFGSKYKVDLFKNCTCGKIVHLIRIEDEADGGRERSDRYIIEQLKTLTEISAGACSLSINRKK